MNENTAAVEIPQYRCHKVVRAAKITAVEGHVEDNGMRLMLGEIGGQVDVDDIWLGKHGQLDMPGGYYVVYDDGYTSFSPAKAFEEGYARIHQSHQQRVVADLVALEAKFLALGNFFDTKTFANLSAGEQELLGRQYLHMDQYAGTLRERIAAF